MYSRGEIFKRKFTSCYIFGKKFCSFLLAFQLKTRNFDRFTELAKSRMCPLVHQKGIYEGHKRFKLAEYYYTKYFDTAKDWKRKLRTYCLSNLGLLLFNRVFHNLKQDLHNHLTRLPDWRQALKVIIFSNNLSPQNQVKL